MICSDSRIESEIRKVTDIFSQKRIPRQCCIRSTRVKFNTYKSFGPSKCPVYTKLLWIEPVSQVFADNISKSVMCCIYLVKVRTIFTTRPAFLSSQKNILPILGESMLIYKFPCQCDADYIVRTIQRPEVQVRQHIPRFLLNRSQELTFGCSQAQESAIGDYICESYICQANYLDQCFSVLYKANKKKHLAVLESIAIRLNKPNLCKQRRSLTELCLFGESGR